MTFRVIGALAAVWVVLGSPDSARGQCAQWVNSGFGPPAKPFWAPASWEWTPPLPNMVYDSRRHVAVLFGGDFPSHVTTNLQTFRYDGSGWVYENLPLTSTLAPFRIAPCLTFNAARGRTFMYGGLVGVQPTSDLWEYDGTNWYGHPPSGAWPRPAAGNPICYDANRGRVILLGTSPSPDRWETWEWDGNVWSRAPDLAGVSRNSSETRMVFDISRNRAFVSTTVFGDPHEAVWEYTPGATAALGQWHNVPILGPAYPALFSPTLVYDPHRRSILRIGGKSETGNYTYVAETWAWNVGLSRWILLSELSDGLPPRNGAAAVFDTARDRVVLYGGSRAYLDNGVHVQTHTDTWEYIQNSPGFRAHPSNATVDGGTTAVFAATVLGDGNTLQWLHDWVAVSGAVGPFLAVNNASQALAGLYVLRATNACGVVDSAPARLTVRAPANNSSLTPSVIYSATIAGTTLGATPDGTTTCGNSNASPDVWYRYTVPYTGTLTMDTCGSDYDTVLSLHTMGLGSVIGCSDDNPPAGCGGLLSSLSFAVTAGQQFMVRVSGYNGAAGHFTLNTRVVPFNNACAAATPVFGGTYVGNTVGASVDGTASCGASSTTPDIWYRFRSDCSGTLTLDTQGSSYDTVLSVRTGCAGTELACNDDVQSGTVYSYLTVTVQPSTDYYIRVAGFNGATGSVVLNVAPPPIAQDACDGAVPITLGQRTFATRCATTSSLALPPWCEQAAGAVPFYDVWYRYTAAAAGTLEVRLCNTTFNAALAVYGSSCPTSPYDAFICGAREDSCGTNALAALPTLPGEQYLLRVGGYYGLNAGLAGGGTIDLTLVAFETGACCLSVGGCSLTSAYECPGTFGGEGSVCAPSPCPSLSGSCCVGAHCSVLDAAPCGAAGGSFGGTGTVCEGSAQNPVTCCLANYDGAGGVGVQDIFDFLAAWFAADPRADFNGVGGIGVQDIFDFLGAWFAGC